MKKKYLEFINRLVYSFNNVLYKDYHKKVIEDEKIELANKLNKEFNQKLLYFKAENNFDEVLQKGICDSKFKIEEINFLEFSIFSMSKRFRYDEESTTLNYSKNKVKPFYINVDYQNSHLNVDDLKRLVSRQLADLLVENNYIQCKFKDNKVIFYIYSFDKK